MTPVRTNRFGRELHPPREVPRLGARGAFPGHFDHPEEPEPPQKVHPVGTKSGRRTPRRLKVGEVDTDRVHRISFGVDELEGFPRIVSREQPTCLHYDHRHHVT